jgi:hypothetical protein
VVTSVKVEMASPWVVDQVLQGVPGHPAPGATVQEDGAEEARAGESPRVRIRETARKLRMAAGHARPASWIKTVV